MAKKNKDSFVKGAAILTLSTIIVKAVGLIFQVTLVGIVGSEAVGYFNDAYSVFAVFNAIATAGLPVAVSKMISSAYAQGRNKQVDKTFKVALTSFFTLGLICTVIMFVFADTISNLWLPGSAFSIKALAPTVFFVCLMSAVRGYFQGRSHMVPTAVSQIIESVSKVVIGLSLAMYFEARYADPTLSAGAAILGVSASAALGALYLFMYKGIKGKKSNLAITEEPEVDSAKSIAKSLFSLAIPIAIGSCLLYVLDSVDLTIITNRLMQGIGLEQAEASSLKGIWSSMIRIYDLPGAFAIAFSTSILPAISAAYAKKDTSGLSRLSSTGIRMTFLITIPCTIGMIVFADPLGWLLYSKDPEVADGVGMLLKLIAPGTIFTGVMYITNSILQALGKVKIPVINMAIGAVIRITADYILVGIPEINIKGSAYSTLISSFVMMTLNLIQIYRFIPSTKNVITMSLPIILSSLIMGGGSYFAFKGLNLLLPQKLSLILAILVAVVIYAISGILTGAIKKEDVEMMPKGSKLAAKMPNSLISFSHYKGKRFK